MYRHAYQKDPDTDVDVCVCGEAKSEDVHDLLVWLKSPFGSWISNPVPRGTYRCRAIDRSPSVERRWVPDCGNSKDWFELGEPMSLEDAKVACEEHREAP